MGDVPPILDRRRRRGCAVPNRMVREGILRSEKVDQLSLGAEVLFRRLMSVVDDYGRYYASPKLLRSDCFPLREEAMPLAEWLDECVAAGVVQVYEVAGKRYLEIVDFRQRVRAERSLFPAPPTDDGHMSGIGPSSDGLVSGVCGPSRARAQSESKTKSKTKAAATRTREPLPAAAAAIAEVVHAAMPQEELPPDGSTLREILDAVGDAEVEDVRRAVARVMRRRRRSPDSYKFWVAVLPEEVAAVRALAERPAAAPRAAPGWRCGGCCDRTMRARADGAIVWCPDCQQGNQGVLVEPGEDVEFARGLFETLQPLERAAREVN